MNSKLTSLITGLFVVASGSFAHANSIDNLPPVADANGPYAVTTTHYVITLDGSGSYDPNEGTGDFISLYEWDFNGDGTFDWSSTTESNVMHDYSVLASGSVGDFYNVGLRVTDSHGLSDTNFTTVTLVEDTPVPAPAALALIWIGLAGLGIATKAINREGVRTPAN